MRDCTGPKVFVANSTRRTVSHHEADDEDDDEVDDDDDADETVDMAGEALWADRWLGS